MSFKLSSNFKKYREEIYKLIVNFDTQGELLYGGSRNTIKIFKVRDEVLNIKAFKKPNYINQIVYKFFRASKAERSFIYAQKLLNKTIGTPEPVAFYEASGLLFKESYYICKHLKYDFTFRALVEQQDRIENWETILRAFTAFTYNMHEAQVEFLDHSPGNTLIVKNDKNYKFYLVDLNRMNFKKLSYQSRIKNFSRLTPKYEMVKIMAEEYACLAGYDKEKTVKDMWDATKEFQERFKRKKELKKKLKFWKNN